MLEAVAKGTKIDTIPAVFITHLHSDHTLGLAALVYYHGPNAAFRGGGPMTVYGPPGIGAMMEHIHAAWTEDRAIRAHSGEPAPSSEVRGAAVAAGVIYRQPNDEGQAITVPHAT